MPLGVTMSSVAVDVPGQSPMERLKQELLRLPQYQPKTADLFHGGMYCRQVSRPAGVLVVGKVHKKEHFYLVVSGTVRISDGTNPSLEVTGPRLFESLPGKRRAVYAVTDALCMTFHRTDATTTEEAEADLVEIDADTMYLPGNRIMDEVPT